MSRRRDKIESESSSEEKVSSSSESEIEDIEKIADEQDEEVIGITSRIKNVPAQSNEQYHLGRSESGMSQYSDMIDAILEEHDVEVTSEDSKNYYEEAIVVPNKENTKAKKDLENLQAQRKREISRVAHKKLSDEEKEKRKEEYKKKKRELGDKIDKREDEEIDYDESLNQTRTHLFRGKNLAAKIIDPKTGELRHRTPQEIKDYITKKFVGETIYSDGVQTIKADKEKRKVVRQNVKKYFEDVKSGKENTALFNAGSAYSKAVGKLMSKSDIKGNPVVATSKFPWVAAEYSVGQMGGASGGGRGVSIGQKGSEHQVGYDKNKKPKNRVFANNFIISLTMEEYKRLREADDLIDVNVDVRRGVLANTAIEEVTFNSEIDGEYVLASLPMVLPRFDRDYNDMDDDKRRQYIRIFGLDEHKYRALQKVFKDDEIEIGKITHHLIAHYGNLMRAIAVKRDRVEGYEGKFVVPFNQSYVGSHIDSMSTPRTSLLDRSASTGSSGKKGTYLSPQRRLKPKELFEDEKEKEPAEEDLVNDQIARIEAANSFYADDEINGLMAAHLPENVEYISPAVAQLGGGFRDAIEQFIANENMQQAVVVLNVNNNHFTGLHITRVDDNYNIVYFDPTFSLHEIPEHIQTVLVESFPDAQMQVVQNEIQAYQVNDEEEIEISNNHCGAFVTYFLSEMANGNIIIDEVTQRLQMIDPTGEIKDLPDFDSKSSNNLGERIREYHAQFLQGEKFPDDQIAVLENIILENEVDDLAEVLSGQTHEIPVKPDGNPKPLKSQKLSGGKTNSQEKSK